MNIIQVARKHVGNGASMESSARLCLADAIRYHDDGNWHRADMHALKSLTYSIGIAHPDYRKAWAKVRGDEPSRIPSALDFIEAIESDENAPI
jgi:hypothetical protein